MMQKKTNIYRPYLLLSDFAAAEFPLPDPKTPFDSVVVGLAPSLFTYDRLNSAFRVLMGEPTAEEGGGGQVRNNIEGGKGRQLKAPLIATHKARFIATSDGSLSLGPGPFVTALEHASGVQAEVAGKPS